MNNYDKDEFEIIVMKHFLCTEPVVVCRLS
jgi:hypothetical protein